MSNVLIRGPDIKVLTSKCWVRGSRGVLHFLPALSFRGLPCPNLSAGYENAHGRFEYVPIPSMEKNVEILLHLARLFGETEA